MLIVGRPLVARVRISFSVGEAISLPPFPNVSGGYPQGSPRGRAPAIAGERVFSVGRIPAVCGVAPEFFGFLAKTRGQTRGFVLYC